MANFFQRVFAFRGNRARRASHHFRPVKWKRTLLSLERLEDRLAPATLTVNSIGDSVSGVTATLDLREAILLVNSGGTATDSSGNRLAAAKASQISGAFGVNDTIQFDSSLTGQTITLSGSALPAISQSVAIIGLGASSLAISGNNQSGIFMVDSGTQATISGLTIEDGNTNGGGGIFSYGTLTVSNCTFAGNSSSGDGGGIDNDYGTLTVSNSTFVGNSATGAGGGILTGGGGGMGKATVINSTFADNSAGEDGGGITNSGGLTYLTAINCTIADNSSAHGGGIANGGAARTTLNNTLVADNTSGGDLYLQPPAGGQPGVFSGAFDLIGDGYDLGSFANSIQGDPLLAPLGNYGGPTQTIALNSGSPALDAGSVALAVDANGNPLTTDQRGAGYPRILNNTVDIGAFEGSIAFQPATLNCVVNSTADSTAPSNYLTLREAILLADYDGNAQEALGRSLTSGEAAQITTTSSGPDTITFDPSLTGQTLTLNGTALPGISQNVTITGPGAGNLAISGNNQSTVFSVDGAATVNISGLTIEDGNASGNKGYGAGAGGGITNDGTLTVSDCILTGNAAYTGDGIFNYSGTVTASNCTLTDNFETLPSYLGFVPGQGGGIFNLYGTLTVSNCTLTGNRSGEGSGIYNAGTMTVSNSTVTHSPSGSGDGIYNIGSLAVSNSTLSNNSGQDGGGIYNGGTLAVSNSTVSNNGGQDGGGIYNGGTLTVSNSTFAGNSGSNGGGVYNFGGKLSMSNCTLTGNSALIGGGIANVGTATLTNTTVSDNSAGFVGIIIDYVGYGGGIWSDGTLTASNCTIAGNSALAGGSGGGIFSQNTLTASNCTIAGNSALAGGSGGGITNHGTLTASNCTVAGNSATNAGGIDNVYGGSATLNNTLVAGSTSGGDLYNDSSDHSVFSGAYDLIGDGSDLSSFTHSLSGNPLLAPLGNYGGPTQTMALLLGSPAIDAGSVALAVDTNGNPLTTDQRGAGFPRILNNTVDIGAFESQGFTITLSSGSNQSALVNTAFAGPLVVAVAANNPAEPVAGGIVTFTAPTSGASAVLSGSPATVGSNGQASVTTTANGTAGAYTVTASIAGAANPASFSLANTEPPSVTTNPTSQTVIAGSNVSFTVAASGYPTPTVQWQVSTDGGTTWTAISGATSTTLTLTSVTAAMNGYEYEAVFSNSVGSVTTTAATLTVDYAPSVTTNPTNQTVTVGQNAAFIAAANGNPTPTVQWQVSTDGGTTWTAISGATNTTLTLTSVTAAMNGYLYEAVFTNSVGSATTSYASLTVDYAPTVTTNPTGQTVTAGSNVSFTAAAGGNPSPTVQWQVSTDGGTTWTAISGATSTTLTLTSVTTAMNGNEYQAVFTNSVGTAITSAAILTVRASSGGPVNVTSDVSVTRSGFRYNFALHEFVQTVTVTNTSGSALSGLLALQLTNLSSNATLANASGTAANGDPYFDFVPSGGELAVGQSITVTLYFKDPTFQGITYGMQVWQGL